MELIPPPMLLLEVPQDYDASSATPSVFFSCLIRQSCKRGNRLAEVHKILIRRYQKQVLNTINDILQWDPRLALLGQQTGLNLVQQLVLVYSLRPSRATEITDAASLFSSVSSDSSEESVGTPAGRVILFGTIPTTLPDTTPTMTPPATHIDTTMIPTEIPTVSPIIPSSPDYTPASPDYSHASDTEFNPSEDPHLIHHGRRYRYHPNGPIYMMTARKRVGPLPTHRFTVRHSVYYSSSDPFTSDDSSETSSDSSSDDLSDSSSSHSSSDHSSPALPSGMRSSHQLCLLVPSIPYSFAATTERPSHSSFADPSRKRSRSPTTSVPRSSPIPGSLSPVGSDEPPSEHDINLKIQAEIDECIAYADSLRAEGIDARVMVGLSLERRDPSSLSSGFERILKDQGHRIVATGQQSVVLSERTSELKQDNMRLRGTLDVAIPSIPYSFAATTERPSHSSFADPSRKRSRSPTTSVPRSSPIPGSLSPGYGWAVAREEVETSTRGPVDVKVERVTHLAVREDIPEPAREKGAVEDQGHRIVATGQQSVVLSERTSELKQDNMRLRGTLDVASQREGLRNKIVSIVKQSVGIDRPGAANMKPRELSDAIH
nr:hypothetical protein [Tanacetum cinerariifolium]